MKNGKKVPRLGGLAVVMTVAAVVGMAALWLASCNSEVKYPSTKQPTSQPITPASPTPVTPRLQALELEPPLVLSPEFNQAVSIYSVAIQGETNPVTINATPEAGFTVEFPLGQQVTPLNGSVAVVNAVGADGRKTSYYIQFITGDLPLAKLSSVMLSAGSVPGFSQDTTGYDDIAVPFGVQNVTVFPAGAQTGSYFTFPTTASVELDTAGMGTVTVGVIANGYRQNEYTFNFKRDDGLLSVLGTAGIALSGGGALAADFNPQAAAGTVQTIIVPFDTEELTVFAVKQNWRDTVHFDDDEPSDSKIFAGNLHGTLFSITVNCGIEYADKTYQFEIQKSTETAAVLSVLSFKISGTPVTVYRRTAADNGENLTTEGFDPAYNLYNFNFAHNEAHGAASAEISAGAETGAVITVLSGANPQTANLVNIPLATLESSRPPVQLRVSLAGKTPNTYTIYFKKADPPAALLNGVTITGIVGEQPDVAGVAGGVFDVEVYANTQFVVINADVPGNYSYDVSYKNSENVTQNYLLAPDINTGFIEVTISGGDDYWESVYIFNFTTLAPLLPRLTTLLVDDGNLISDAEHDILEYRVDFAYSDEATPVAFLWTVDTNVVSRVQYSLNYGAAWQPPEGVLNLPSTELFSISPTAGQIVLIKVTALDGAEVVYNITVTKAGGGTNLLSDIVVTTPAGAVLQHQSGPYQDFREDVFSYTVLLGSMTTEASVVVSWLPGSVVRYTLDNVSHTLTGTGSPTVTAPPITVPLNGPQKPLTIAVHPQADTAAVNTYTVVFAYAPPIVFNADNRAEQTFAAPYAGQYKIECWGAQGGSASPGGVGGMGGYSYGTTTLTVNQALYVYVGAKGEDPATTLNPAGGWNGGGAGGNGLPDRIKGGGGGGASDVRAVSGLLNPNLTTRIIVAGGGGGAGHAFSGGSGGGGNDAPDCNGGAGSSPGPVSPGAAQEPATPQAPAANVAGIVANSLGIGQTGRAAIEEGSGGEEGNGGGGGGYYGGLAKTNTGVNSDGGGGGGSGFVQTNRFIDIGGARGVNAGNGRVQFTYLGPPATD